MLDLPEKGFHRSVTAHNVRLDVMSDWIEASVAFVDSRISQSDVVDVLAENSIYDDQTFAAERVGDVWHELARRSRSVDEQVPFETTGRVVARTDRWTNNPSYSFCMMLSLLRWSPGWIPKADRDFNAQGELFERLTAESLEALGWEVLQTGWAKSRVNQVAGLVSKIAVHLKEVEVCGAAKRWTKAQSKDAGLDVVCEYPFADGFGGRPIYLLQCASGGNWEEKLGSPDLRLWMKLIDFTNEPLRGFAMPFALDSDDFRRAASKSNGLFLDRYRLADGEAGWESASLAKDLVAFTRPLVKKLPVL